MQCQCALAYGMCGTPAVDYQGCVFAGALNFASNHISFVATCMLAVLLHMDMHANVLQLAVNQ